MHAPRRLRAFATLFAALAIAPAVGWGQQNGEEQNREERVGGPEVRVFAVRTTDAGLTEAIREGAFFRWIAPREPGLDGRLGADVSGAVEVEVSRLPVGDAVKERLRGLPLRLGEGAISLGGELYHERHLALAVRLPRAEVRSWVVVGWQTEATAELVDLVLRAEAGGRFSRRLPSEFDFLLFDNPWTLRSGRWEPAEEGFGIEPGGRDDLAERAAVYRSLVPLTRPGLVLRAPASVARTPGVARLADALAAEAGRMAARVPVALEPPLEVVVEEDYVSMGRHLGTIGAAVVHGGRVHLVYHADDTNLYAYGLARLLVRRAGIELAPWLEDGAALWLSEGWYGRSYRSWLPDLAAAEVLPRAEELLASERESDGSDVLWPPAAAAVVEGLPGETLRSKVSRQPGGPFVEALLGKLGEAAREGEAPAAAGAPATAGREPLPKPAFLKGVSLAMPPGLEDGYHSPSVDTKLEILRGLGVDSVALMPFAFMSARDQPDLRSRITSPTDETDVGLIQAARRARGQGFRVLWKPHVYVMQGGSWSGEIRMLQEADWERWWRGFRRYMVHQAVLASYTGSEMLSLGVELGGTLEREQEWRQLIASVRSVYPGRLTYAGNWWGDYDRVPFWDALDDIGVDAYFPLAEGEAEPQALRQGVRRMMESLQEVAEREGKGIVFTEVGYAARRQAWSNPHEEGGEFSAEDQRRAFEALLGTLGRPSWLEGMFLWKVFTHPGVASGGDTWPDFRFLGRPAQDVVEQYYRSPSAEP